MATSFYYTTCSTITTGCTLYNESSLTTTVSNGYYSDGSSIFNVSGGTVTLVTTCINFDSDALAFVTATGISDSTQQNAINNLVIAAKANGWWTLCTIIYPFVGGTATTHQYNLKDPRDLDVAYRLTFTGSWTHSSNGMQTDRSTTYADTHLVPSTGLTNNNVHISHASNITTSNSGVPMGASAGSNNDIYHSFGGVSNFAVIGSTNASATGLNTDKYFLGTRTGSTYVALYSNGTLAADNSIANTKSLPAYNILLGAYNFVGTPSNLSDSRFTFATIGAGISSTIAALMYTDIQAFQTTLGR